MPASRARTIRSRARPAAVLGLAAAFAFPQVASAAQPSRLPVQASARNGATYFDEQASPDARRVADWVVASGDNQGLPFVIVDKVSARVLAFDARGLIRGAAPALLGLGKGDDTPAGIGSLRLAQITPAQRITPAGRFEARLGRNLGAKDILWVDYESGISLHRVVTGNRAERRLQRLATPSAADNRISYGCINVPVTFYEDVVQPLFAPANGIVYVLPETRPLAATFDLAGNRPPAAPSAADPVRVPDRDPRETR